MVEVSYLASFLGGLLSLLSPCSALLLPAFFAYAFGSRMELVRRTVVFYLGLAVTLVPLGMGISAVSRLVYGYRGTLILASGLLLIAFGVIQLLGRGFTIGPLERLRGRIKGDSLASTFALGAVYGFAGFCSGPILGAVLTVAAASGTAFTGAALLATYAAGMAAPLFVMALLWDRFDLGHRRWLRGREVSVGGLRLHTTNLISGLLFIVIGVLFIIYEGTSALEGLYASGGATDLAFAAQQWANGFAENPVVTWSLAALAILLVASFLFRRMRGGKARAAKHRR
ncbi:MAG: cytochrome c biogenesis protein CcdA [Rubrobacter sp.]|nr:cytochrome c biogenesis protein CcdA [Rubrobacter sp.]